MLRRLWKRLRNSNHGPKENGKIRHRPLRAGLEPLERRELLAIIIDSYADLQAMKDNLSGAYELAADINCAGNTFTPVGTGASPFTGSLNGKGYTITSLRTSSIGYGGDPYIGLFGHASGATLTDVVLENVDIDASGGSDSGYLYAGGLAGKATNTSITDCEVSGDVDASSYGGVYAGGLVGYSSNTSDILMLRSETTCTVDGRSDTDSDGYAGYGGYVGGLVGRADGLDIDESSATGAVSAYCGSYYGGQYQYAGGLVGYSYLYASSGTTSVNFTESFASGSVQAYTAYNQYGGAPNSYAGGLVGYSYVGSSGTGTASTTVDQCYAAGNVDAYAYGYYYGGYGGTYYGGAYAGGLIGYNYLTKSGTSASATISNDYATGSATARASNDAIAGGLIGNAYAYNATTQITNCYSIGVPDTQYDASPYEGGLVGYSTSSSFTSCYWDTTTSGKTDGVDNVDPDPSGVTGKTTHEMMQQSTFSGWDFDCDGLGACHNGIWFMAGYPHLQMEQKFLLGGSIHITNVAELQSMQVDLDATYYLDNDIDASETADWNWDATDSVHRGFEPVGDSSAAFSGKLFGGGHKITGLFVNRKNENSVGLFGRVENATLDGVILENVDIDGNNPSTHLYAGALAGEVYRGTTISDCSVSGTVTAQTTSNFIQVGGLAGLLYSTASISGSASTCTVSGTATASGVWAGGLVGEWYPIDAAATTASVTQSYATGNVTASATSLLFTGGLIGELYIPAYSYGASATLSESYATGDVSATGSGAYTYAGGLIACLTSPGYNLTPTSVDVTDCYATGDATISENSGSSYAGGLIGILYTGSATVDIGNCYSIGDPSGADYNGGLVGHNTSGSFASCYWDTDTSGTTDGVDNQDPDPSGVTGKTTAQMRAQSTFTNWDFDVSGVAARDNGIWIMAGYPHLQMEWSTSITNVYQVQMMALDLDASYSLANNISASETSTWNWVSGTTYLGFQPVGRDTDNSIAVNRFQQPDFEGTRFTGALNGSSRTITGLFVNRPDEDFIGLFGYVRDADLDNTNWQTRAPLIQQLTIHNPRIVGRRFVGGLAGVSDAKVQNCTVSASTYDGDSTDGYVRVGGAVFSGTTQYVGFDGGGLIGKSTEQNVSVIDTCTAQILVQYNTVGANTCDVLNLGGLVGHANDVAGNYAVGAKVINSTANGAVLALTDWSSHTLFNETTNFNNHVGGLVGEHDGIIQGTVVGSQQYCTATGAVSGARNVGGLIGELDGYVEFARATGGSTVQGRRSVGGLIGMIENGSTGQPGEARDCLSEQAVTGVGAHDTQLEHMGGFVGQNEGGFIADCTASGAVSAPEHNNVGGFAGSSQVSTIGGARDHDGAGGLVAGEGFIADCIASGAVTGRFDVGGFVGQNANATITRCGARGDTTLTEDGDITAAEDYRAGGFVGYNENDDIAGEADISQCYAIGNVLTQLGTTTVEIHITLGAGTLFVQAGGFVGWNRDHGTAACRITDSYCKDGTVAVEIWAHEITLTGGAVETRAGGFAATTQGGGGGGANLVNCYTASGTLSTTVHQSTTATVTQWIGGLVGALAGTTNITGCFWDFQTIEPNHNSTRDQYYDFGVTPAGPSTDGSRARSTTQMKTQSTYTDAGWTFDATHWELDANEYPEQWWED